MPLSDEMVAALLAFATPEEKQKALALLALLRADREAEPEDTRRPLSDFLEDALVEQAGRSSDPIAFGSLSRAFAERQHFHLSRLLTAVPASDDVGAWMGEFSRSWHQAEKLTAADGLADPAATLPAPAAPPREAPLSTLDIERIPSGARRPRPAAAHDVDPAPRRPSPVIDTGAVPDPLGPFRGSPNYYDGPIFPDN